LPRNEIGETRPIMLIKEWPESAIFPAIMFLSVIPTTMTTVAIVLNTRETEMYL
jgi:hypothetical protein